MVSEPKRFYFVNDFVVNAVNSGSNQETHDKRGAPGSVVKIKNALPASMKWGSSPDRKPFVVGRKDLLPDEL